MTRTDVHRPSAINPADYVFVAFKYIGPNWDVLDISVMSGWRKALDDHMTRTGGKYAPYHSSGTCHICGASAMYLGIFYHAKTNTYINVGETCTEKMEFSDEGFNLFHTQVRSALEHQAGKAKARAVLSDKGLLAAWEIYADKHHADRYEENTISNIVSKLVQYGNISEKQESFMVQLLAKIPERAVVEARRAAEAEAALPIPISAKRITIEGIILATKVVESTFGDVEKMLVKHSDGWKVWGSMPSSLMAAVGDIISFDALVTPSNEDAKFGFFSRPTKAKVIKEAPQQKYSHLNITD